MTRPIRRGRGELMLLIVNLTCEHVVSAQKQKKLEEEERGVSA